MSPILLYLLFLILVLSPISSAAQSYTNVSLGKSLTASNDDGSSWVSPSGDFAFGFRQIGNPGGFLLAIWFNKIHERTIVWSANRDEPVQSGSKVELKTNGQLVLSDSTGKQIWIAEAEGTTEVAYAAMLDTGNFVLVSPFSSQLWQSFNHPTDTILPTQIINQDHPLIASYSRTNYSRGRFMLVLQSDGALKLKTHKYPLFEPDDISYWSSNNDSDLVFGSQLVFNQYGYIYLVLGSC